jgi:two-component system chemotaxis response regulator CheB
LSIRLLIVDDSRVGRAMVARLVASDGGIDVVGNAENGQVALDSLEQLAPDVILLDIEMPTMDGIAFLRELRRRKIFIPVLVFSSLSRRGALITVEALAAGAADYVTKPSMVGATSELPRELRLTLLEKIRAVAQRSPRIRHSGSVAPAAPRPPLAAGGKSRIELIVIGVSTGGPLALNEIFEKLPANLSVPIAVVQHMPRLFTEQLAKSLGLKSALPVAEAQHHGLLVAGHVYIAPGGQHMRVRRDATGAARVQLSDEPPVRSCRPSVDLLFESAAITFGARALGVVLTGMGSDGLTGAHAMRGAGGEIYAQDEATSVVWGMPGEVVKAGLASKVLPIGEIAPELTRRLLVRP